MVALACQLPAATGVPLARWSGPELATEITKAGLGSPISPSSVLRILAEHPIKPGDKKREKKKKKKKRKKEKKKKKEERKREREEKAKGALALLAALDVRTGKVFASTPATTGITPFMDLISQVMNTGPYASAPRVFVIADNGSDHRGRAAVRRLAKAHPNAIMIHTPVHASWLNQIEIFFSIIQKKVISPNDFASPGDLSATLLAFVDRYNQAARPFNWNYTATDLARYLSRISGQPQPASMPEAA